MNAGSDEELRQIRARVDRVVRTTADAVAETRRVVVDTRELVRVTGLSRAAARDDVAAANARLAALGSADAEVSGAA